MPEHVDKSDQQAAQTDRPEAVGKGAPGGAARGAFGCVARGEVPCAVDARDGGVDGVLEPLADPEPSKSDEDEQANDNSGAAIAATAARRVCAWLVFDVDSDESDGKPGPEGGGG